MVSFSVAVVVQEGAHIKHSLAEGTKDFFLLVELFAEALDIAFELGGLAPESGIKAEDIE